MKNMAMDLSLIYPSKKRWIFPSWCKREHQRVHHHLISLNHHFPMVFLWFSYGFPMVFRWFSHIAYGFPVQDFAKSGDPWPAVLLRQKSFEERNGLHGSVAGTGTFSCGNFGGFMWTYQNDVFLMNTMYELYWTVMKYFIIWHWWLKLLFLWGCHTMKYWCFEMVSCMVHPKDNAVWVWGGWGGWS